MGLAQFRDAEETSEWAPERVKARWTGRIMSFDQSLADTGWVLLKCTHDGPEFVASGMIITDASDDGHEGNHRRAAEVREEASRLLSTPSLADLVVYESPPVMPPKAKNRSDAVNLAGLSVRIAAQMTGHPIVMRSAQSAKKRWTGNSNASKGDVRACLLKLYPDMAKLRPFNEHIVDAISIGLHAWEERTY